MIDFLRKLFGGTDLKPILENGATLIDVRSPEEFKKGSASGARNIPLPDLGKNIDAIKKMKQPIVTCCASGMRSGTATERLKSYRIEAYNGGSWQKVNKLIDVNK